MSRHFSKEDIQMANEDMKKCSKSLDNSEIQIKTTVRYYCTPNRMAIIKETENNKYWQRCGEIGTHIYYQWKCEMVQPLWKTFGSSSES